MRLFYGYPHRAALLVVCLFAGYFAGAQHSRFESIELYHQVEQARVLGSVLYIGVTPEDKNTPLLTWLSKEKHYRTGYLSMTRGENSRNLAGIESGMELGIIHAQESVSAAASDGIEHFFLNSYDPGYAGSEKEVLAKWDVGRMTAELIWVIRSFHPDVIISRYEVGDTLHARGSIVAKVIKEAFRLAADTAQFSDQIKYGAEVWQAKRLLYNELVHGTAGQTALAVYCNTYDAARGMRVKDIASYSNDLQRSIDFTAQPVSDTQYLRVVAGEAAGKDMMEGIDVSWNRIDSGKTQIQLLLDSIQQHFNFLQPEALVTPLLSACRKTMHLPGGAGGDLWRNKKVKELQHLIVACAGIKLRVTSESKYAVQGVPLPVRFAVRKNSAVPVTLSGVYVGNFRKDTALVLAPDASVVIAGTMPVEEDEVSQPYWLQKPMPAEGYYEVAAISKIGDAVNEPDYTGRFDLRIGGMDFFFLVPLEYEPVAKELTMTEEKKTALLVKPVLPVIVSLSPENVLMKVTPVNEITDNAGATIRFKANFTADSVKTTIRLAQMGYHVLIDFKKTNTAQQTSDAYYKDTIMNFKEGEVHELKVPLKAFVQLQKSDVVRMLGASVIIERNGEKKTYSSLFRTVNYGYIPEVGYYSRELSRIIMDEIKTRGRKIGFVFSRSDRAALALQQMGFVVKELQVEDFTMDSLKQYDAVITGARLDDISSYLEHRYDSLLAYVHAGGNLIIQGQDKPVNLSYPYQLKVSSFRISNQLAPGTLTFAPSSVFTVPNIVTTKDLDSWHLDLCRFTATQYDTAFHSLLTVRAEKENKKSDGLLLCAAYGNGNYIYTSLVLSSQLADGIVSGYRLLANLIALPGKNVIYRKNAHSLK